MKHSKRRLAIVASTTAAVLLGGGIAVAYWTSSGSGSANAATGNTTNVTVAVTAPTGLIPGAAASPVSFTVTNPDTAAVTVNAVLSITSGWSSQADGSKPACTASDFTLVNPTPSAISIPGGATMASVAWGTYSIALNNNTSANQDNCKNITVPLVVTAS